MEGTVLYDMDLDVGGSQPIRVSMAGKVDSKPELDQIYALLMSYVVQAQAAKRREEAGDALAVA